MNPSDSQNQPPQPSPQQPSLEIGLKPTQKANHLGCDFVIEQWRDMLNDFKTVYPWLKIGYYIPTSACTDCSQADWSIEYLSDSAKENEKISAYATFDKEGVSLICFCKVRHRHIGAYVRACSSNPPDREEPVV